MSTSRVPGSTVRTSLAVACLAGVLLTGCQDSDSGTGAGSEPSSDPPSATPSESQGREPADGPVVKGEFASYRVPSNFEVSGELAGTFPADEKGPGRGSITLGELPNFGNTDLDFMAKALARSVARGRLPKPVAETTLAGEPAFHLEGQVQPGQHFTAYGAVHEDQIVYVRFDLDGSRADNVDLIESVLATWQWK